jgi:hypothetical protein
MVDLSATVKNIVETGAVLVAGWWTYRIFVKTRSALPRATVTHRVSHRDLPDGRKLIQVTAVIKNEGTVLLDIPEGLIRLQQVLPLPAHVSNQLSKGEDPVEDGKFEVNWVGLGQRRAPSNLEIEPLEADQVTADFFVNEPELQLVQIYTYFKNVKKKEIGWGLTTLYDLGTSPGTTERTFEGLAGRSA